LKKTGLDKGRGAVDSQVVEAVRLTILKSHCKAKSRRKDELVDLDIRETGAVCVLKVKGRFTSGEPVSLFENAFQRSILSGHICLVLDLEAVTFIDSSAIGSVVNALRQTKKAGGAVRLVNPSNFVSKTFKMVGILPLFSVHASEQDAIDAS